ncbi:MAG TPA: periplasmic heavy metal sensor, partial [Candidatus Binatia bacterium]|nr:periplasmic heavy metal sensor [Candidatus Binatia bacterium]
GRVPRRFGGSPTRQQRMEEALKKLPQAEQERFRDKFAQIRAAGDPLREQMDAVRNEALRLMSAETFDEAAYDQQVKQFDDLREEAFKRMSQVIKQTANELSPEQRRTFAELLRRPPSPKQN